VCLEASDALAISLSERTASNIIGASLSEILPAARNWGLVFARWHQSPQGHDAFEVDLTHQDGAWWTAQVAIYPRIIDQQLHRIWVVARDITRQAQALHALSSIESHYQAMLNAPNTLSFRISPDGTFSHMSPASISLLGLLRSRTPNHAPRLSDIVASKDEEALLSVFRSTRPNPFPLPPLTMNFRMSDGSFLPFIVRQHPTWSNHYVMESCDVIASQLAPPETHPQHSSIQEAQGHYRKIAHDLNNFLMATRTHLNRLGELSTDPEALRLTSDALETCVALTDQFFNVSRQQRPPDTCLLAYEQLQRIVEILRPAIPDTIDITVEPDESGICVHATKAAFAQIFSNLILNASEALGRAGSIILSTRPVSAFLTQDNKTQQAACIEVRDNGPGIAEAVRARLFKPHTSTKSDLQHHGLGLASVKSLVEGLGGSVRVESSSAGTLFSVILQCETTAEQQGSSHTAENTPTSLEHEQLRILVADDEPLIRDTIQNILTSMGHSVSVVSDGRTALKRITSEPANVDVILLDDHMPTGRASTFAQQIIDACPSIRIIVTSGNPEAAEAFKQCGSQVTFLAKPFTPSDFTAALRRASPPR